MQDEGQSGRGKEGIMSDRTPRKIFDQIAKKYDEIRPGYPEELIEDITSISGIPDE